MAGKLRIAAKGQDCTLNIVGVCNYTSETTVLCHINYEGGMMGGKEHDISACFGCSDCHSRIDSNEMSKEDWLFYTSRALVRTIKIHLGKGDIKID